MLFPNVDGLYRWDLEAFRAINLGHRSPLLDLFFLVLSFTGLGGLEAVFVLALYPWPRLRRFIVPLLVTDAFSGFLIADGIKALIHRDRPSGMSFAVVQEKIYHSSFVSGHTTTAFACAFMLLFMTLGTRRGWIGPLALLWATGVGVSRIYRGVHWPTDVVAGALAGALGSAIVYLVFEKKGWLDLKLARRST